MGRLTQAQRQEKAQEAVNLSAMGLSYTAIGKTLSVSRQTATKLIDDELAKRAEHRGSEREASIARNIAVIKAAWERFEKTDNRSLNASGYLNTIIRAGERIDKLTGAEAPSRSEQNGTATINVVYGDD